MTSFASKCKFASGWQEKPAINILTQMDMEGRISQEQSPFANLRTDTGFKNVFCDTRNKEVLKTLLNTFLPPDRQIHDFAYAADRELQGITTESKVVHLDLRCVDEQGRDFIVEMQNYREEAFFKRCLFYCARVYSSKLQEGKHYKDLMPVYLVAFMTIPFEEPEFNDQDEVSCYKFYSERHSVDDISIIFVRLHKAKKNLEECVTDKDRCIYYLWNMCNMTECPEEAKGSRFEQMFHSAEVAAFDRDKRLKYEKDMRTELDIKNQIELYRKEGRKEGAMAAKCSIALALLKKGLNAAFVSETTGLSLDEISSISLA